MDTMIKEKLQEFGFSEKEVKVYLAMLEAGPAVASAIAKKAGIKRSTTYVVLDALAERGMVQTLDRRGIQVYQGAPPEQLVQYLQGMAKRYAGFAEAAKEVVSELPRPRPLENVPKTKVRFFEGEKSVNTVYEDTLASLEDIRVYAAFAHGDDVSASASQKMANIKMQIVFPGHSADAKKAASERGALRETLLASRGSNTSSEINVYDDRVIFISTAEDFAVSIESRELADAMRKTFAASEQETLGAKKPILRPAFA